MYEPQKWLWIGVSPRTLGPNHYSSCLAVDATCRIKTREIKPNCRSFVKFHKTKLSFSPNTNSQIEVKNQVKYWWNTVCNTRVWDGIFIILKSKKEPYKRRFTLLVTSLSKDTQSDLTKKGLLNTKCWHKQ